LCPTCLLNRLRTVGTLSGGFVSKTGVEIVEIIDFEEEKIGVRPMDIDLHI